jgi:hypothetical protein
VFALAAAAARNAQGTPGGDPRFRNAILSVYERAKSLAVAETAAPSLRCQALQLFGRSLGDSQQEQIMLAGLLAPTTPLDVQLAAVERLAAFRNRDAVDRLLSQWPNLSYSVRSAVALQLVSTTASTEVLVGQLESGKIDAGDLSPSVRQTLRQSNSQSLQARVNRVLGKTTAAEEELVQRYLKFQRDAAGDADLVRGRELFQKHCAACHIPDQTGMAAGPGLSNLTDRSPRALTEAILVPNRSVEPRYHGYVVLTTDGRVLTGIIAEEAGDALTLSLADGKRTTIHRSEIEEFRNTRMSLMPDGFYRDLDPPMLRDLIEYVRSESFAQTPGP